MLSGETIIRTYVEQRIIKPSTNSVVNGKKESSANETSKGTDPNAPPMATTSTSSSSAGVGSAPPRRIQLMGIRDIELNLLDVNGYQARVLVIGVVELQRTFPNLCVECDFLRKVAFKIYYGDK